MDNPENKPTPPPTQSDISYVVMPTLARKAMVEPVEPKPAAPKPPSSFHLDRKYFYAAGGVVLVSLGVLVFFMMRGEKEPEGPPPVQTRLPKVWLTQYFGSETCLDASKCSDEADPDADGLGNYNEFKEGANPVKNDTDSDGLADGDEVNIFKTDPGLKYTDRREIAVTNDYSDAVSVANNYDPLTPGIKMTESRLQQIATDTTKYSLHEPSISTIQKIKQPAITTSANITIFIEAGKFNPQQATISRNDTVIWLNKDQTPHVVASDPHPAHTGLPGLTSAQLSSNQTFSFKFENVGTFGYHDHLNPGITGTIIVK